MDKIAHGRKIILGISGSIAAYKSALLTRLFVKNGHEVQVLMTAAATNFIAPLTLSTLSGKTVLTEIFSEKGWHNHVELGLWADAVIIAPASANTIASMANGICDNILLAVYLSARCPVFIAPAMDVDMWHHPATQNNIKTLEKHGVHVLPVGTGELASGLVGEGRMAEPEEITEYLADFFDKKSTFKGKKALVTAGPTFEPLDPVRFIGNHSTGKMGIAIAESLAARGADVTLVLGPTSEQPKKFNQIEVIKVSSAQQMFEACDLLFNQMDITVLAAAVADYRPAKVAIEKIKKKNDDFSLELIKTIDIAATLGKRKRAEQIFVGFALETNDEIEHAKSKLVRKNFDFIVLNSLRDAGAGFGHDTNKISIYRRDETHSTFDLQSKKKAAEDIVFEIEKMISLQA